MRVGFFFGECPALFFSGKRFNAPPPNLLVLMRFSRASEAIRAQRLQKLDHANGEKVSYRSTGADREACVRRGKGTHHG